MRLSVPAGLLAAAALLALPATASSQAAGSEDVTPSLAKPLASCYSPSLSTPENSRSFIRIATDLTGPPGFDGSLLVVDSDVDGTLTSGGAIAGSRGTSNITFDAAGRLSTFVGVDLPGIGPAKAVNLRVQGRRNASQENPAEGREQNVVVGTTRLAGLGVQVGDPNRPSSGPSSRPKPVVISGAPFAGKTLYGFIVEFKAPRNSFGQDPARSSRKVVRRVKLGKGDACGYLKKKVALNARVRTGFSYQLYVNAGSKLNKPRAVYSRI